MYEPKCPISGEICEAAQLANEPEKFEQFEKFCKENPGAYGRLAVTLVTINGKADEIETQLACGSVAFEDRMDTLDESLGPLLAIG